jgi:hypothetical protein
MKVPFAFLADFAVAHPDGKIYVIGGGWDTILVGSLPATHPHLSLVLKFEFTPAECGLQHTITIHPLDADGAPFLQVTTMQAVPQKNPQYPRLPVGLQYVLNVQGLMLTKEGEYIFSILVDGQEAASIPIRVARGEGSQGQTLVPPSPRGIH